MSESHRSVYGVRGMGPYHGPMRQPCPGPVEAMSSGFTGFRLATSEGAARSVPRRDDGRFA